MDKQDEKRLKLEINHLLKMGLPSDPVREVFTRDLFELFKAKFKQHEQKDGITCPFCGVNEFGGFDREGLKFHLSSGHCEVYNETENVK